VNAPDEATVRILGATMDTLMCGKAKARNRQGLILALAENRSLASEDRCGILVPIAEKLRRAQLHAMVAWPK
jgi:hypothetical protein